MSPKSGSSSRSPSRRSNTQPKSSRQQFSACGACRMRRVRCDLKDLQNANPNFGNAACSNCQERGLKCVDEFAEVKAVKLLRRGRRLQQVEAVYGKAAEDDRRIPAICQPSCIPKLRPEFFRSPFFYALLVQRPVVDPHEFTSRFFEAQKGGAEALSSNGQLLCMVIATWAASFGVNEQGEPEHATGPHVVRARRERTNMMVRELLQLIDLYGLLRRPSWDGVRILLLITPLTEDVQTHLERLAMYESAINQVYTLCSLAPVSSVNSGRGEFVDAAVRARIFWYAYAHEGITTGLRGGRLLLNEDDLLAFEATLPAVGPHLSPTAVSYQISYQYAKIPLRISAICRQVHSALTGPKSRQRNHIDVNRIQNSWNSLTNCWDELEGLRQLGTTEFLPPEEVERFINGWQIVIFECFNVVRDALKQRLVVCSAENASMSTNNDMLRHQVGQLYAIADNKCQHFGRLVIAILHRQSGTSIFKYDASLVRDGCFYTGLLLANETGSDEDVTACLNALRDMRWGFSKGAEREHTLSMIWEQSMSTKGHREDNNVRKGSLMPQDSSSTQSSFASTVTTPDEDRMRNPPPPLLISTVGIMHDVSAPTTAVTEDGGWSSSSNGLGPRSHRSASGSPPFLNANPKLESLDTSLMLAPLTEQASLSAPLYYPPVTEIDGTFAYTVSPGSAGQSPHDFTPPRSSAGMSTSSVSSFPESYIDGSSAPFFVSPPGSARGPGEETHKGGGYHVNYNTNQFYTSP